MKILFSFFAIFSAIFANENTADFVQKATLNTQMWGNDRVNNIDNYNEFFAPFFVSWQSENYFATVAAVAVFGAILVFLGHYLIVGAKQFSHSGTKILVFKNFERMFHLVAAISWVILVPTGLIMMFGEEFGGGFFVRFCKNIHGIATISFAIAVVPMFLWWFKRMLPAVYDIKWMLIIGGYLSKKKSPVPAGKFNAGQKAWFWVATCGGFVMILSGAAMFFLDFNAPALREILGVPQIEILRLCAIIHNILGVICATFFIVHVYMTVFAIKGSIHSMISGFKEEEEVYILHHFWYQELVKKGEIAKSKYENEYKNL